MLAPSFFSSFLRTRRGLSCLIALVVIVCSSQAAERVSGNIYRNDAIGLDFAIPFHFSPKVESEIHPQDPSGREHVFLALWQSAERTGVPRMAFLYDSRVRPLGRSRELNATLYLAELKQMWVNVPGVKISGPTKIAPAGYPIWRLDYWQPNDQPHFNCAVAIPLADRRLILIQINAPSQSELNAEVDSLSKLHFDKI